MEQRGYIRLHRCLLENPISKKPVYAWLWTTLLLLANHQPNKFMWNGDIIIIKEGELLTGRKELSLKTGIPETTIEDILKYLERQHQIRQQKTTKFRIITIIEWKKYQSPDIKSDNKPKTSRRQADTNKNDKNDKNDKNISKEIQKASFGNEFINKLTRLFLAEAQMPTLSGSVKENRYYCHLAIKKWNYETVEGIIKVGVKDNFHQQNLTGFKYLYYNGEKIIKGYQSKNNK